MFRRKGPDEGTENTVTLLVAHLSIAPISSAGRDDFFLYIISDGQGVEAGK